MVGWLVCKIGQCVLCIARVAYVSKKRRADPTSGVIYFDYRKEESLEEEIFMKISVKLIIPNIVFV